MTTHNMPHAERFWMKVEKREGGCWLWTGATSRGYGQMRIAGKSVRAHRWSWEHVHGSVPVGLVIDHVCKTTRCVNPEHLEPVTQAENIRRGRSGLVQRALTHCLRGHPFDAVNTARDSRGHRLCKECKRTSTRLGKARKRQAAR